MKPIAHLLNTISACDDTFDKISYLNGQAVDQHNVIIVLSGNFEPDVFEWLPDKADGTWWRYCHQQKHTEITEERYDYYHEVLPPVYLTHIDGNAVQGGFACSEAFTHLPNDTVVLTCCYKLEERFYECLCAMFKINKHKDYIPIRDDAYNAQWTKDNAGITYIK